MYPTSDSFMSSRISPATIHSCHKLFKLFSGIHTEVFPLILSWNHSAYYPFFNDLKNEAVLTPVNIDNLGNEPLENKI